MVRFNINGFNCIVTAWDSLRNLLVCRTDGTNAYFILSQRHEQEGSQLNIPFNGLMEMAARERLPYPDYEDLSIRYDLANPFVNENVRRAGIGQNSARKQPAKSFDEDVVEFDD